jgi:hypothetical protein
LEEFYPRGLRISVGEQYRLMPANMDNLPEHSGAHQCDVFNPGARKVFAAPPWSLQRRAAAASRSDCAEPRDKLGIRVENEVYRFREGKVVIFDDAYEHEAWNRTQHMRVVLFVDFRKPLRFPASLFNWLLLHLAVFTPFIREGIDNQKAWEKKFYAEAEALRNG